MKYSVVIPLYNGEKTIGKAVMSVLNQTRADLIEEIIIVNDGSTDKSLDAVDELKKTTDKIVLVNKKNGGAASARNEGIRIARNNYIALLDADDIWMPEKMEVQDNTFSKYPDIKALGCNRDGENLHYGTPYKNGIYRLSPLQYCFKNWPCTPALVFDKRIFDGDCYFPEDMTHAEEGIFFLTLAYKTGLYYVDLPLVLCGDGKRAFGVSGLSGNIEKMHHGVIKMIKKAAEMGYIKRIYVPVLIVYENIKYLRRRIIMKK